MATVQPFRGIHYDPAKASDLSRVLAPPLDPLDRDSRRSAMERDAFNVARLLEAPSPRSLDPWLAEQILVKRASPGIYPYASDYTSGGKRKSFRAFIAQGAVTPPENGGAFALEEPLPWPSPPPAEPDADVEPILMLYSGAAVSVEELLSEATSSQPLLDVTDSSGTRHRLWEMSDSDKVAAVCRGMEPSRLLLARGAETYRASLASGAGWRMMTLAPLDSPGLTARPLHRVIHVPDEFDFNHFFETLGNAFDVYPLYGPDAIQGLLDKAGPGECRIVAFIARPRRCLLMVPKTNLPEYATAHSERWRKLDTAVLHGVILDRVVGVGPEKQADPTWMGFRRGVDTCVSTLQNAGRFRIAFLLNPVRMEQAKELAMASEPLPAGSLEVEPNLPAGLIMRARG